MEFALADMLETVKVSAAVPVRFASIASLSGLLSVNAPRFWVSIAPVIRSRVQPLTVKEFACQESFLSRCIVPPLNITAFWVTSLLNATVPLYPLSPIYMVPLGVSASVIVPSKLITLPDFARKVIVPAL